MGTKRKQIGQKLRFEVFKRDSFTCQYCGDKAPNVILHVDHIQPVADGGSNELINLITSCVSCNLGKGPRRLGDDAVVQKQQAQLEELQERREQLEMMVQWQRSLVNLEQDTADMVAAFWGDLEPGKGTLGLNEYGRGVVRQWLTKHNVSDVLETMREAAGKMRLAPDGTTDHDSVTEAFHLAGKLLRVKAESKDDPFIRDAYYVRGILRRRFGDAVVDWEAKQLLLEAMNLGVSADEEKTWARYASSYYAWRCEMQREIAELRMGSDQ